MNDSSMDTVIINIQNLKCGGCAMTIKLNLEMIEGVSGVEVNDELGIVKLDQWSKSSIEEVKRKLRKLGYPLEHEANPFVAKVKSYASCVAGRMNVSNN